MSSVNWFTGDDTGVPIDNSGDLYAAGALISILDACLVNGYGSQSVSTMTLSEGTVTVAFAGAHGFKDYSVIEVAGANEGDYNGKHKIRVINSTSVSFSLSATPTSPATGTITAKVAGLGWEKVYSGTNLAVYRSLDESGNRPFLRVDDTSADVAKMQAFASMTDIDTGTDRFPDAVRYWQKRRSASNGNHWEIVGDAKRFFYFSACYLSGRYSRTLFGFGDGWGKAGTEAFNSFLWASSNSSASGSGYNTYIGALRSYAGGDNPVQLKTWEPGTIGDSGLENGAINGVPMIQAYLSEGNRIRMPLPFFVPFFDLYRTGAVLVLETSDGQAFLRMPTQGLKQNQNPALGSTSGPPYGVLIKIDSDWSAI